MRTPNEKGVALLQETIGETTNWLPAPEGEFAMTIRAYGAEEELINGDWSPPPVKIGKG